MHRSILTRVGLGVASLALGALLVLDLKAPEAIAVAGATTARSAAGSGSAAAGTTSTGSSTSGTSSGSSSSNGSSSGGSTSNGGSGTTFTGALVTMRYGQVQVQITVRNGKVTAVSATALPVGGRSGMISAYVEPILSDEALTAQSAQIDSVSGATYTSAAYERSLQSALDQAGL